MSDVHSGEGSFADAARQLASAAGLLLGWRPGEFWAATPAELANLIGADRGAGGVTGDELQRLRSLFPD